jgi:anti-anti-sigma regulatory factor
VESLLSAVVADSMSGTRHNSNVELVAQGIANFASPLFGGIPATGAIARTATNIRAGARTPVAGVIHAAVLLIILAVAAPLARYIPLATLSAVLFVVAYNMGEWREIGTIVRLSKADIAVWAVTFALTVLADLTVAVEVGMILAALLYIYRISQTTTVLPVTEEYIRDGRPHVLQDKQLPWYVAILRIHGPFLFGTTEKLAEATTDLSAFPAVVIVRLRNMTALDATGLHALEVFAKRLRKSGRTLLLCGARDQPAQLLHRADFIEHIGRENVLPHVEAACSALAKSIRRSEASAKKWLTTFGKRLSSEVPIAEISAQRPRLFESAFNSIHQCRIVRRHMRLKTSQNRSVSANQEFREVPLNVAARLWILALVRQVLIQRNRVVTRDRYLRHHRKRDVVLAPAELLDLRICPRLLLAEIIGGNAENHESLILMLAIKRLKARILGRIPTAAGDIHDHQHLTFEVTQRHALVVD